MRKLSLVFVFLVSIVVGNTQPYPLLGSPNGNTIVAVNALKAFQLPRGTDTTLNGRNDSVGMLFYKTDKSVWLRVPSDGIANRWVRFGGSFDSLYATQAWALSTFPQLALQYNDPSWVGTLNTSKLRNFGASTGQVLYFTGSSVSPNFLAVNNGWGVTGGGNLTPSRTLSVDSVVVASKDFTNATYALRNRAIVAGYGLAGGGDLSADRSFIVDSTVIASKPYVDAGLATKQNSLTNPITGTGVSGRVPFYTGTNTLSSDTSIFWNNATKRLGIGTNTPRAPLEISGDGVAQAGLGLLGINSSNHLAAFVFRENGGLKAWMGYGNNGDLLTATGYVNGSFVIRSESNLYLAATGNVLHAAFKNGNTIIGNSTTDNGMRLQVHGKIWQQRSDVLSNSPKGYATLVNGVVTISNTLATTGCFIQVNYITGTALSGTSSILTVSSLVNATSFTVTAYTPGAATTNTSDNNTIEYTISN